MSVATFTLIAGSHLAQLADIGRPLPASPCCVAPCLLPSSPRRAAGAHLRVRADTPPARGDSSQPGTSDGLATSPHGTDRALDACASGARTPCHIPIHRR